MPLNSKPNRAPWLLGALAFGLAGAAALPAVAQTVVDEITVIGRYGPNGPKYLSRTVSFADLDLTTAGGRHELDRRIRNTAYDLCRELGEQPKAVAPPVRTSCEQQAVTTAKRSERIAFAEARPRGYAVLVPAPAPPPDVPYAAPVGESAPTADIEPEASDNSASAPDVSSAASSASYSVSTVTNGPVADTPANRARFGGPMSNAGKRTKPAGN